MTGKADRHRRIFQASKHGGSIESTCHPDVGAFELESEVNLPRKSANMQVEHRPSTLEA